MSNAATILFAGTPEFARVSLQTLVDGGFPPVVVLTQPDRPAGRGKKMTASPVKEYACGAGIEVWQPTTLRDPTVVADIQALRPQLMIVAAYGLILPQAVLDVPVHGCVNVHASLLPRWRGAAPIQNAILSGDAQTGISLMQMEAGLDTGPVYVSSAIDIGDDETAGELHDRLARLGGELLLANVADLLQGSSDSFEQDDRSATYAKKIEKQDARIDWSHPADEIVRSIRAYNPIPGAHFKLRDERIKCWRAERLNAKSPASTAASAGQVVGASNAGVDVACIDGTIRLTEVQRPGRKRVTAAEFAAQIDLADAQLS